MAQRVITLVEYTDDLTGELLREGEGETLTYVWDGSTYEIDLGKQNAEHLRDLLAPYLAASRKLADTRGRSLAPAGGSVSGSRRSRREMQDIREWGRANGYKVPEPGQGRVPWGLTQAYDKAMQRAAK